MSSTTTTSSTTCDGPGCDASHEEVEGYLRLGWIQVIRSTGVHTYPKEYDLCSSLCLLRLAEKISGAQRLPTWTKGGT